MGSGDNGALVDGLVETDAERASLSAVRQLTGTVNGPMERHSVRVFLLADQLAGERRVDRELLMCAALLHDLGLYPGAASSAPYVTDGRRLAERILGAAGWSAERIRLCGDAIERHHEPRAQWRRGVEVELIRRADLIEVSQGLVRFGLPRASIRDLRRRVPVDGFVAEVARQLAGVARHRPWTLPRIFNPRG